MGNNNVTEIRVSRNLTIFQSRASAIIALNNYVFHKGEMVAVTYYTTSNYVNVIFAVGVLDGKGKYNTVSLLQNRMVKGVRDTEPRVKTDYLWKNSSGVWYLGNNDPLSNYLGMVINDMETQTFYVVSNDGFPKQLNDIYSKEELLNYAGDILNEVLQSDWAEEDPTKNSYIRNKPESIGRFDEDIKYSIISTGEVTEDSTTFNTYRLQKKVGNQSPLNVGDEIKVPYDCHLSSGIIKEVTQEDKEQGGMFFGNGEFSVGKKYLDLLISIGTDLTTHLYILLQNIVSRNVYTPGIGINIENSDISLKLRSGLRVDENKGLTIDPATSSTSGAMTSEQKQKLDSINDSRLAKTSEIENGTIRPKTSEYTKGLKPIPVVNTSPGYLTRSTIEKLSVKNNSLAEIIEIRGAEILDDFSMLQFLPDGYSITNNNLFCNSSDNWGLHLENSFVWTQLGLYEGYVEENITGFYLDGSDHNLIGVRCPLSLIKIISEDNNKIYSVGYNITPDDEIWNSRIIKIDPDEKGICNLESIKFEYLVGYIGYKFSLDYLKSIGGWLILEVDPNLDITTLHIQVVNKKEEIEPEESATPTIKPLLEINNSSATASRYYPNINPRFSPTDTLGFFMYKKINDTELFDRIYSNNGNLWLELKWYYIVLTNDDWGEIKTKEVIENGITIKKYYYEYTIDERFQNYIPKPNTMFLIGKTIDNPDSSHNLEISENNTFIYMVDDDTQSPYNWLLIRYELNTPIEIDLEQSAMFNVSKYSLERIIFSSFSDNDFNIYDNGNLQIIPNSITIKYSEPDLLDGFSFVSEKLSDKVQISTIDTELSNSSDNLVQGRVVKNYVDSLVHNYKVTEITDLSRVGLFNSPQTEMNTANCYIVSKPGKYKIPLVYGNAIKNGVDNPQSYTTVPGGGDFVDYHGNLITSPYIDITSYTYTTILWWQGNEVDENSFEVLTDQNNSDLNYLVFEVLDTSQNSNVLISIMDDQNNSLWSWHIWIIDSNLIKPVSYWNRIPAEGPTGGTRYDLMPVNLGYTDFNNISGSGSGLYYQWGRKDPFSSQYSGDLENTRVNTEVSIATPNKMYIQNGKWNTSDNIKNYWNMNDLTGGPGDIATIKTIYDPCPPGWVVPNANVFRGFTTTGREALIENVNRSSSRTISNGGYDFKRFYEDNNYMPTIPSFLITGHYDSLSGILAGNSGYYYTSSMTHYLEFNQSRVSPMKENMQPGYAMQIRPMLE